MKKLIKLIVALALLTTSGFSVSAATKTIATVSFKAYDMAYYDSGNQYWYIGEGAVTNSEIDEYGCVINQYGMTSTNAYAAVKRYQLQTDCDFSFEGTMSLVFNEGSDVDQNAAQIDFFVCTSKGKIIYPSVGNQFESVTKNDGAIAIKGEAKHLQAGDSIYFVAINKSTVQNQYLQFATSIWETEYDQVREGSFSDTNVYKGIQGEDGWSFMCAKTEDIVFGTAEAEVKSVEGSENSVSSASRYPEDSGIVVSTAKQLKEPATIEDAKEPLMKMKTIITAIVIVGAAVLITQGIVFESMRKKKVINSDKEVK